MSAFFTDDRSPPLTQREGSELEDLFARVIRSATKILQVAATFPPPTGEARFGAAA